MNMAKPNTDNEIKNEFFLLHTFPFFLQTTYMLKFPGYESENSKLGQEAIQINTKPNIWDNGIAIITNVKYNTLTFD